MKKGSVMEIILIINKGFCESLSRGFWGHLAFAHY